VVFVNARHNGVWAYGRLGVAVAQLSRYKKGAGPTSPAPFRVIHFTDNSCPAEVA